MDPVQERRRKQRFRFEVPLIVRPPGRDSWTTITRDLSTTGIFFYADEWPADVKAVELTLVYPPEVLDESARVRCTARVLRVGKDGGDRNGVAVAIEHYSWS